MKINKNTILVGVAIIGIVVTAALIFAKDAEWFKWPDISGGGLSNEQVGQLAVVFINNSQLTQVPASLVSVSEEYGLVKIKLKIGSTEYDSYVTKDGKLLFPEALEITPQDNNQNANSGGSGGGSGGGEVTKSDSPMLEAFVVSRCPYGLQMQRAMAEAVINQPSLAQYIKARYIGAVSGNTITAMHGTAEAQENLRQICIREEQPAKYWPYVSCQMKAAGTENSCAQSTGVDSIKLNACISDPSKGVAYAKEDFDLANQLGVTGSPTLALNGTEISESGYGGRSADGVRAMACAGFGTEPGFCATKLNTAAAASSFSPVYSSGTSSSNSDAGCDL